MPYTEGFYLDKGVWKVMTLTEAEVKELEKEHRRECNRIMEECVEDANENFLKKTNRDIIKKYELKDFKVEYMGDWDNPIGRMEILEKAKDKVNC